MSNSVNAIYNTIVCSDCGCIVEIDRYSGFWNVDDDFYCEDCFSDNYGFCDDCGECFEREDLIWDENSEQDLCPDCYRESRKIHEYSYKPLPVFHGNSSDNRFYGIELEVDDGGNDDDTAMEIVDMVGGENLVYCKSDCSLEDGFEIVSHPCTLDYHKRFMNWDGAMDYLNRFGYTSHDNDTCGLHVHVDRNAFTGFGAVERFTYLFEKFFDEMVTFSRRTIEQVQEWCDCYGGTVDEMSVSHWFAEYVDSDCSRYRAVNLRNRKTVEIRINKGTLNYNTFIASLEMIDFFVSVANSFSDADAESVTWSDLLVMIDLSGYECLNDYLIKRNLK